MGATGVREEAPGLGVYGHGEQGDTLGGHQSLSPGRIPAPFLPRPLLSQPLSVLEAPPGFGRGELVHIPHLVVGLVAHGEGELVAEADLLLLGVGKEQDLGDG